MAEVASQQTYISCQLTKKRAVHFKTCVILPAGGSGLRFGTDIPKQYNRVIDRPLVSFTIEAFERISWIDNVIVVVAEDRLEYIRKVLSDYNHRKTTATRGEQSRHRSMYNGIKHINQVCKEMPDVVILHDAVRPLVTEDIIQDIALAGFEHGSAGCIRPLVSTVIATDPDGFLDHSLDRSKYRASETPQAFQYKVIKSTYEKCDENDFEFGTECLHLVQKYMGLKAKLVEGPDCLWKVTYKKDLYAAEGMLRELLTKVYVISEKLNEFEKEIMKELKENSIKVFNLKSLADFQGEFYDIIVKVHDYSANSSSAGDTGGGLWNSITMTTKCLSQQQKIGQGLAMIHIIQTVEEMDAQTEKEMRRLSKHLTENELPVCIIINEKRNPVDVAKLTYSIVLSRDQISTGQLYVS